MVTNIDRAELVTLIANGAQIVDVLPSAEFEAEHIPGAVSIQLQHLTAETSEVLSRDKPVVVY